MSIKGYLTCTQAAQEAGVDKETMRRWCRGGLRFAVKKIGLMWLIEATDFRVFLSKRDGNKE